MDSGLPNIIDSLLINLDNLQLGADFTEEMTFNGYHNISHMTMSFRVACQTGFCGRDCTQTGLNNPRILSCHTDGDIVCTDSRHDLSANCNKCLNTNYDPSTNCTTCLDSRFDPNNHCTSCLLERYDPLTNCTQCLPNHDPSTNCSTCPFGFDISRDCSDCLPGRNITTNCTTCLSGYAGMNCTRGKSLIA